MGDLLHEIEERLALVEEAVAHLKAASGHRDQDAVQVTAPFQVMDSEGNILLKVGGDIDGGYLCIQDLSGKTNITLGCSPSGGFLDIIHTGSERLAITLTATEEGQHRGDRQRQQLPV